MLKIIMGQMYKIQFKTSGKAYIGISSISAAIRWTAHSHPTNGYLLGRAFRKYGVDDATLTILGESDSWPELCAMEIAAIAEHQTMQPTGYNLTSGGGGTVGYVQTSDQRAANSVRSKKRLASPGKLEAQIAMLRLVQSRPEVRAKMSAAAKSRLASPEARARHSVRISAATNRPEVQILMSESAKKRFSSPTERAAQSARLIRANKNPAVRASNSERAKKYWASPEARAAQSERIRNYYRTKP